MKKWQHFVSLLGRGCLSLFFIISSINKAMDWQNMEQSFTTLLCDWQSYVSFSIRGQLFFSYLLEWVPAILMVFLLMEFLGGLLIFLGWKIRMGVVLLLLFIIPVTILFHPFWFFLAAKKELQLILFLKNLAIIGGLLYVFAFGGKEKKKPVGMSPPGSLPPSMLPPPSNMPLSKPK